MTRAEAAAIITHAAFYVGWPKGWAVFRLAKDVWKEETVEEDGERLGSSSSREDMVDWINGLGLDVEAK